MSYLGERGLSSIGMQKTEKEQAKDAKRPKKLDEGTKIKQPSGREYVVAADGSWRRQ